MAPSTISKALVVEVVLLKELLELVVLLDDEELEELDVEVLLVVVLDDVVVLFVVLEVDEVDELLLLEDVLEVLELEVLVWVLCGGCGGS